MSVGLLAVVDDILSAALKASAKSAGVVIDDAAVTPQYVQGLSPARELPVVGRIAAGGPILAEQAIEDVFPLPKEIVGEAGVLTGVRFAVTQTVDGKFVETDESFVLPADMVLKAIGQTLGNPLLAAGMWYYQMLEKLR